MTSIPQGKTGNGSSLPDLQGAWTISQPIEADLHLVESGHLVEGIYCSTENKDPIKGTIKGALSVEGDDIIFAGRWADQMGSGDFKVFVAITKNHRERDASAKASFQGRWKHSHSRDWDGEFIAEMR